MELEYMISCLGIFLFVAIVVFCFIAWIFKSVQLTHRYWSVVLCLTWGFIYPILHKISSPSLINVLLFVLMLVWARHLWIVDKRRHQQNEELWAVLSSLDLQTVKSYLSTNPNINVLDKNKRTPVGIALEGGKEEIAKLLLQHNAKFTGNDFLLAISKNFVQVVTMMIEKGADINEWNFKYSMSPLECAVNNNCVEIVKQLLHKKADVGYDEKLLFTSLSKQYDKITSMLLEKGAYGYDALMYAIQHNLTNTVIQILDNMPTELNWAFASFIDTIIAKKLDENFVIMIMKKAKEFPLFEQHYDDLLSVLINVLNRDYTDISQKKLNEDFAMILLQKLTDILLSERHYDDCINLLTQSLRYNHTKIAEWFVKRGIYDKKTKLLAMKKGYASLVKLMLK